MATLVERIIEATADGELCNSLVWSKRSSDGLVHFIALCNDVFAWAYSDCEDITEDNIDLLEQTIAECEEIFGYGKTDYAIELFCARARQMRPQNAFYNECFDEDTPENIKWRELFDAAGPEREEGGVNPVKRNF